MYYVCVSESFPQSICESVSESVTRFRKQTTQGVPPSAGDVPYPNPIGSGHEVVVRKRGSSDSAAQGTQTGR